MLRSQASSLPGHIQAVYVHNILKLATATLCKAEKDEDAEIMEQVCYLLCNFLFVYFYSHNCYNILQNCTYTIVLR